MDAESFIDAANKAIIRSIETTSTSEGAWDGFGGLVLIGESALFREEGLFTAYAPLLASSSSESHKLKSATATPASRGLSSLEPSRSVDKVKPTDAVCTPKPLREVNEVIENSGYGRHQHPSPAERDRLTTTSQSAHEIPHSKALKPESREEITQNSPLVRAASVERSHKSLPVNKMREHTASDVDRFKSRLMAVRSEGLPAKETALKCAGIADDAYQLAVKKLRIGEFSEAYLLAEVAESACPASTFSARSKLSQLKQSALKRFRQQIVR